MAEGPQSITMPLAEDLGTAVCLERLAHQAEALGPNSLLFEGEQPWLPHRDSIKFW